MHNAPSVSYPVGRPQFAGWLAAGVWLTGAAGTGLWFHGADSPGWRQAVAAAVLLIAGGWVLLSWLRSPIGELGWDGTAWAWPSESGTGGLDVTMDLQFVLLVRRPEAGSACWLWLERSRCPHRWLELRRAVYSRARPAAPPPGRPPVANP